MPQMDRKPQRRTPAVEIEGAFKVMADLPRTEKASRVTVGLKRVDESNDARGNKRKQRSPIKKT